MAFDTYMKIEGIPGEATHEAHKGEIELFSWSIGASNPTTVGPGSEGLGAGRVTISEFSCMKKLDKASPVLFQKMCQGEHIQTIDITMNKAGGKQQPFLFYNFEDCLVTSIQWSGATGGDDRPMESTSFCFAQVKIKYQLQDDKGNVGKPVVGGWNVQKVIPV
jgi:type VI secretion system secreted protein Hcp